MGQYRPQFLGAIQTDLAPRVAAPGDCAEDAPDVVS
jgi:hypothetical protein